MKKTALTIIGMLLGLYCSSQHISDEITLGNGDIVDFSYIFKPNDSCTFHSDEKCDWKFCIYYWNSKSDDFIIADQAYSNNISFQISDILQLEKHIGYFKIIDIEDKRYTVGYIELSKGDSVLDKRDIYMQLTPSQPKVIDFKFDYDYDWDYDDLGIDGGILELTLEIDDDVERIFMICPDFYGHLFQKPDDDRFFFGEYHTVNKIAPRKTTITIDQVEWGIFMKLSAINRYGTSQSLIVNTTDFITDPKVLERINSLNPNASIDSEPLNEPEIIYSRDELNVNGEINDFKIEIYNIVGHKLLDNQNERMIDISGLPSGVFVVLLKTDNQIIKTLKISR